MFSFYLFVLQQDESHYGNVDGVPDAGVVEQTRHLQHTKAKEIKPERKTLPRDTAAGHTSAGEHELEGKLLKAVDNISGNSPQ